jgi:4-diphosphocytidyl-2-C-methyl-D-erythritol kinase
VTALTLRSPAKVNLFLEVLDRRADGYHEIESVMQLVDLCDTLTFRPRADGIRLTVSGAPLPEGEGNIAYRAARAALEAGGVSDGVEIAIEKRIPVAAGLGGGSSNAAAVLAGVTRLYGLRLGEETLFTLGAALGSDVPFFLLRQGLALARGRGERLTPLTPWPPRWLVIANPGIPISTAWVYGQVRSKLTNWQGRSSIHPFVGPDQLPWPPIWAFNRLESVVLPAHAEVCALRDFLAAGGGSPVLMSGSGASVLAVVSGEAAAAALAASVRSRGWFAEAVTTLSRNPMWDEGASAS